ncbi:hypothetical protein [Chryseolinea sp. H1M3-3]|uniref:hypothetical protein n=1 Tax=Chryseolinea sp. H1M3-3 TaxID=3034144 RepID=UPI0023ED3816|nr:hypothetical protein [Chryseolinea sp. H1M3-3]
MEENEIVDQDGNEIPNPDLLQAHGLTHAEMAELHNRQKKSLPIPMMRGNNTDNIKDEFFQGYSNYELPVHERGLYHVLVDQRYFHPKTGIKESIIVRHKLTVEFFEFQKEHHAFDGCVTHILHFPESAEGQRLV